MKVRPASLVRICNAALRASSDRRAAGGFKLFDPLAGVLDSVFVSCFELVAILVDGGGEVDHREAVFGVQVRQAVLHCLAGLLHLDAAHAARRVQHQHHVARNYLSLRQFDPRRQQQERVPRLIRDGAMRQGRQADVLVADGVEKLKILVEQCLFALELNHGLAIAGPRDADGVRRAVDVLNRMLRFQLRLKAELFEGRVALPSVLSG